MKILGKAAGILRSLAAALAVLFLAGSSCARRSPILAPPTSGVDAVEGYASASVRGAEAQLKGKFSFLFRRPGFGRVEGLDAFGRSLFEMLFAGDKAYLILPSRKVYAEDDPDLMMDRLLGFALSPGDVLHLLSGQWPAEPTAPADLTGRGWALEREAAGRIVRGVRDGLSFTVSEFAGAAGVPRTILFAQGTASGRMTVLSMRFNPPARPGAFDVSFLERFDRKLWDEIVEIMRHEG